VLDKDWESWKTWHQKKKNPGAGGMQVAGRRTLVSSTAKGQEQKSRRNRGGGGKNNGGKEKRIRGSVESTRKEFPKLRPEEENLGRRGPKAESSTGHATEGSRKNDAQSRFQGIKPTSAKEKMWRKHPRNTRNEFF